MKITFHVKIKHKSRKLDNISSKTHISVMPKQVTSKCKHYFLATIKVRFVNCQSTLINHLIEIDYSMFTHFLLQNFLERDAAKQSHWRLPQ